MILPADIPADWQRTGSCRKPGVDLEIFFTDGPRGRERAKGVCGGCPVENICLRVALINQDNLFVLGGTTGEERTEMLRLAGLLVRKKPLHYESSPEGAAAKRNAARGNRKGRAVPKKRAAA